MKILLVHPPSDKGMASYAVESLGLGYLAAVLRCEGHEIEVLDAHLQCLSTRDTIREILSRSFDCLGITAMQCYQAALVSIVRAVRKKKSDALIVAGGYLPSLSTHQLLLTCPQIDVVVRGEGEATAVELFGKIERGEQWRDTPGIAFLADGAPVLNTPRPLITDLDSLPSPARDAIMATRLRDVPAAIAGSRGCYHRCSFCCINSFYEISGGGRPRLRSPARVADEMEAVVASTSYTQFMFLDEDFVGPGTIGKERPVQIADEILARRLEISFSIECRSDEVDEDVLKRLKEAGLTRVFLGVESGVQRQLDTYNKNTTTEQNRQAIEVVQRAGLELVIGFIPFDPYTTPEEIEENNRFVQEHKPRAVKLNMSPLNRVMLYPGTPLTEKVRADGLLRERGLSLDYTFKDPQVEFLLGVARAAERCSRIFKRSRDR